MKNLREKINSFLKLHNLKYFKSDDTQDVYRIVLPYKYNKVIRINIFIDVFQQINLLKIGFNADANNELHDEIKTYLLDMNGKLVNGSLSLESNGNIITYFIDWEISDNDDISFETYSKKLAFCINVYDNLLEHNFILRSGGI